MNLENNTIDTVSNFAFLLAGPITWKITSQKPCGFGGICCRKRTAYAPLHLHEQQQSCFSFVWLEREQLFSCHFRLVGKICLDIAELNRRCQ